MGGVVNAIFGGGNSGSSSAPAPAPSSQSVSQTSIPSYAQPYVETMLGQTQALTDVNQNPYQTYGGERIAEFSPLQQQAFANVANQTTATQLGTGTDLATQSGYGALSATGQVPGLQTSALGYGSAGAQYGDVGQMYGAQGAAQAERAAQQAARQASQYGRQSANVGMQGLGYGAQGAGYGQGAVNLGQNTTAMAAQQGLGYGALGAGYGGSAAGLAPQAQGYGQGAADIGMGGLGYGAMGAGYGSQAADMARMGYGAGAQFAQQATNPAAVQAYMSPYIEGALAPQLKLLNQQQQLASQDIAAKSVAAGAFGGNRATLAQGLNAQNYDLARQQAIGQGYEKAFQNAQAQQQFGANLGLQGLQAGYQGTGMGIQGAQAGLAGLGTAMQGQQTGLQGLGQAGNLYGLGMQGAQTGLSGLQGALAGSAQGLQGYQAGMQGAQTGLSGLGTALQGIQGGQAGVSNQLNAGQLGLSGTAQGIQGAQAAMQGAGLGLQGVQGAIGAGQYGLQGLGQASSAAGTLGQLGQTQFGQQQAINQSQQTTGAVQQAQAQQALDQAYQDFLKQKNYPYQQLAFMSDMLRGLPLSQSAQTQYTAPPSAASQLGGLGMAGLGIYGMSGGFKAKGGMVGKGYANGGLMAAKAYKDGGYAIGGNIESLNVKQLREMLDNKNLTPQEVEMIERRIMLLNRMQSNPQSEEIMAPATQRAGIGAIATGDMVPEQMAGGGIVAFADGGGTNKENYQAFLENQVRKSIEEQLGGNAFAKSDAERAKLEANLAERKERSPYEALAMAGLGTMAGSSQYGLTNLGLGATEGLKSYSKNTAAEAADRQKLLEQQVYADKAEEARKAGLTGQMQTTLGQMYNRQAAASAAGEGADLRNLTKAAALVNNDPVIKGLEKQQAATTQPGTPEYEYYDKRIAERQNQIYKTVGVKVPEVTASNIQFPTKQEEPGLWDKIFGSSPAKTKSPGVMKFDSKGNPI